MKEQTEIHIEDYFYWAHCSCGAAMPLWTGKKSPQDPKVKPKYCSGCGKEIKWV